MPSLTKASPSSWVAIRLSHGDGVSTSDGHAGFAAPEAYARISASASVCDRAESQIATSLSWPLRFWAGLLRLAPTQSTSLAHGVLVASTWPYPMLEAASAGGRPTGPQVS